MVKTLLETLIGESLATGWAISGDDPAKRWWRTAGTGNELDRQARALGLEPSPNRRGDPLVTELRPTPEDRARPASLSAMVGLGQQPLHTDGAHLRAVPKYVVLWSAEASATPTRVWNPRKALHGTDTTGMFMVEPGGEPFLAQGAGSFGGLRFDPGCMSPVDGYARRLAEVLQNPPPGEVVDIHWDRPGMIVVLRNRHVLHGRAEVADDDSDRRLSRIAYVEKTP